MRIKKAKMDGAVARLLEAIGEDQTREGLLMTPTRVTEAWAHWSGGYDIEPADLLKTFEDGAEGYTGLVLLRDIPVYSHCEHHLAPFFGVAHVAYIPDTCIVGLSKLARVVDAYMRRLQVQERLTQQIATVIDETLHPVGVGVVLECRHMCLESRGIQARGSVTITSSLKGALLKEDSARSEFMRLVR